MTPFILSLAIRLTILMMMGGLVALAARKSTYAVRTHRRRRDARLRDRASRDDARDSRVARGGAPGRARDGRSL